MTATVVPAHRRADIQGLRGISMLLIVAFHVGITMPGGFVAVDVFIVISGFVITGLLLRELEGKGRLAFRKFYAQRFRRLIPALALVVTVVALLAIPLQSPFGAQRVTAETGIGAMLISANVVITLVSGGYFDGPAKLNALLNTWSLSVEEQLYLMLSFALALSWVLGRNLLRSGRARAFLMILVLMLASFALNIVLSFATSPVGPIEKPAVFAFYSSLTRVWEFGFGALLAFAPVIRGRLAGVLGAVGLALLVVSLVVIHPGMPFPGIVAIMPVAATAMLIAAGPDSLVSRGCSIRPLVWVGDISYSWYLWHWPLIVLVSSVVPGNIWVKFAAGYGALIPAWFAYRYVETPIRYSKKFQGKRLALLAGICLGAPILACLVLLRGSDALWGGSAVQAMASQVVPLPLSTNAGCSNEVPIGQRAPDECVWNAQAPGAPIYLVGDSQAGMLSDGMFEVATLLRRPLRVAESGSCPFVLQDTSPIPLTSDSCQAFVAGNVDYLATAPQGTVVIAIAPGYLTPESVGVFQRALSQTIATVQGQGHQVVLLQAIPQFPEWTPWTCTLIAAWTDPAGCGESLSESELRKTWALGLQMFDSVAMSRDVALLDLWPQLCSEGQCATNRGATWDYRDARHISVGKSLELTPVLTAAVSSARMSP